LIYISFITREVEHFFMYLLARLVAGCRLDGVKGKDRMTITFIYFSMLNILSELSRLACLMIV
jgi:hypothetical protein